jgi:hypothetical protein
MASIKGILSKFTGNGQELPVNDEIIDINEVLNREPHEELNIEPYGEFSELTDKEEILEIPGIVTNGEDLSSLIRQANIKKISAAAQEDGFDVRLPMNDGKTLAVRIPAEGQVHTVNYSELTELLSKSAPKINDGNFVYGLRSVITGFADNNDLAIKFDYASVVKVDEEGEEQKINLSKPVFAENIADANTILIDSSNTENIADIIKAVAKQILEGDQQENQASGVNSSLPLYEETLNPDVQSCIAEYNHNLSVLYLNIQDNYENGTVCISIPQFEIGEEIDISAITEGLKIAGKITGTKPNMHNLKQAVESFADTNHLTPNFEGATAVYKAAGGSYYRLDIDKIFE